MSQNPKAKGNTKAMCARAKCTRQCKNAARQVSAKTVSQMQARHKAKGRQSVPTTRQTKAGGKGGEPEGKVVVKYGTGNGVRLMNC